MTRSNDELYDLMHETKESAIRTEEIVRAHVGNAPIHQVPPCDGLKSVNTRIWGLMVAFVLACGAKIWEVMSK